MTDLLARARAIVSDAERVTKAPLRKVSLPGVTIGLITLDNGEDHTKPNTFGPASLLELNASIDAALADDTIDALAVTGKPFILAAGADLTSIQGGGPDAVRTVGELGHAVFRKLQDGGKPSFGLINGLALGGGLEVALHCTYRTVMDSAPALGLPEVMLGLVPGWGGAWLVPNLLGADKAVTLILENPLNQGKTLGGQAAYEFGLADAVFNGADFLEQSLLWAASVRPRRGHRRAPRGRPWRGLGRGDHARRGHRRQQDRRRLPRRRQGRRAHRGGPRLRPRHRLRRRGRRPRRAVEDRRAARLALLLRPRAEARQASRRRSGQGAGPPGHQGRHRRRRPDGQPARAALRPPPRGAGRADRPRPGAGRQGRGLRPRRDRQAARQGPDQPGQGQPPQGAGHRRDRQAGRPSATPTS